MNEEALNICVAYASNVGAIRIAGGDRIICNQRQRGAQDQTPRWGQLRQMAEPQMERVVRHLAGVFASLSRLILVRHLKQIVGGLQGVAARIVRWDWSATLLRCCMRPGKRDPHDERHPGEHLCSRNEATRPPTDPAQRSHGIAPDSPTAGLAVRTRDGRVVCVYLRLAEGMASLSPPSKSLFEAMGMHSPCTCPYGRVGAFA